MFKKKILYYCFFCCTLISFLFIGFIFTRNINESTDVFQYDGFVYSFNKSKNNVFKSSFKKGANIKYKKYSKAISIDTQSNVKKYGLDNVLLYSDGSLGIIDRAVGIDPTTINNNIILYYNFFRNSRIAYKNDNYVFDTQSDSIKFKNILLRLSTKKYFLASSNIRIMYSEDKIIPMGNYVYIEYSDGDVVNIYNDKDIYNIVSSNAKLVFDSVSLNLSSKELFYEGKKKISLTNLVLNNDENINLLTVDENANINSSNTSGKEENENVSNDNGSSIVGEDSITGIATGDVTSNGDESSNDYNNSDDTTNESDEKDDDQDNAEDQGEENVTVTYKTPKFKVSELSLSALKIDAIINITDNDEVLSSDVSFKIVQNSNYKVIYEETLPQGSLSATISYANLKPDTEYTLIANADFKVEDNSYNRNFLSKIFRTEDLGLTVDKSYSTDSLIAVELSKENYSRVSTCMVTLSNINGEELSSKTVNFSSSNVNEILFDELSSNTEYIVKVLDIQSDGIIVDKGFNIKKTYKTLKAVPVIGELTHRIDKKNSKFDIGVNNISDKDNGIVSYRWEIVEATGDIVNNPIIKSIDKSNSGSVTIDVDDIVIFREVSYVYRLVVLFNDNEKVVEYVKYSPKRMSLNGLKYPTIRFDEAGSYITWEQINGVIVIDDEFGTIVDDNFKIVLKNSVGVSSTLNVTSDARGIPIVINNLRAEETYTFDVYATLNLNDGNPNVDLVYIGSCNVQTTAPNPLRANYELLPAYNTPFSFNFTLSDPNGIDSSLEASSLSEIPISIYQGENISADKQIYRRVVDVYDDDYISSIAEMMYNKKCLIDPTFFNMKNSDFYETKYTLVISDAHDYTKYKNEIPIENNVYQFDINTYIPDVPEDTENTISYFNIYNRNAEQYGGKYNDELNSNTLVGLGIRADFDNNTGTAQYVEYSVYMYNPTTKQYEENPELASRVTYNEDGSLPYKVYWLGNGTEEYDIDTLNRGDSFRFSYKVYLKLNDDSQLKEYPKILNPNVILYSSIISPNKQDPEYVFYPAYGENDILKLKYKIKDIDKTIVEDKIDAYVNGKSVSTNNITIGNEDFDEITIKGLSIDSRYDIGLNVLYNIINKPRITYVNNGYAYKKNNMSSLTYSVEEQPNQLVIHIDNYYNDDIIELFKNVVSANITLTPKNNSDLNELGEKNFDNMTFEDGYIYISNFDIKQYRNIPLNVKVDVYYDSNVYGFELGESKVAVQEVDLDGERNYYKKKNNFVSSTLIEDSFFDYEFDSNEPSLNLTNIKYELPITINKSGVIYNKKNIILKKLELTTLNSTSKEYEFNKLYPSISLIKNNKVNITALLDSVSINGKLTLDDSISIENNSIYIDLYTTDNNGLNPVFVSTYEKKVDDFKKAIVLNNLVPNTHYQIRMRCKILNSDTGKYIETYLYDFDFMDLGHRYNFTSLERVNLTDFSFELSSTDYSNKNLIINYKLDTIFGFDHISYELYHVVNGKRKKLDSYLPQSKYFMENMRLSISANPSENNEINYGETYVIVCSPIAIYIDENNNDTEIDLGTKEVEFTLEKYTEPFLGISKGETDSDLYFKVAFNDPSNILYMNRYSIALYDLSDNNRKVLQYSGQSALELNKMFSFNKTQYGLEKGHIYKFEVSYLIDTYANGVISTMYNGSKYRVSEYGKNIDLGVLTVFNSSDENNSSISFVYTESYNLQLVSKVKVTISNSDLGFYQSKSQDVSFNYDSEKNQYTWKLDLGKVDFIEDNVYTITTNYYDSSGNLLDQSESTLYV